MSEKYKQCEFSCLRAKTIAWIPAWAAVVGNRVQLKTSELPELFWKIISVGSIELDESAVREKERGYKDFQGSTRGGGID